MGSRLIVKLGIINGGMIMNNKEYDEKRRKETQKIVNEARKDYEEIMQMGND